MKRILISHGLHCLPREVTLFTEVGIGFLMGISLMIPFELIYFFFIYTICIEEKVPGVQRDASSLGMAGGQWEIRFQAPLYQTFLFDEVLYLSELPTGT